MANKKTSPSEDEHLGDEESFAYETEYEFEDWKDIPPEDASRLLKGLEGLIPDVVKRTMSQLLASDDGLRALVSDKNIPKEVVGYLLGQVDATRRGVLRIVSKEIRVFLENVDFGGEVAKILTTLSFEIKTEIRFIPNEERVVPNVKNTVRVRRDGERDDAIDPDATDEEEVAAPPAASKGAEDGPAARAGGQPKESPRKPAAGRWSRRRSSENE